MKSYTVAALFAAATVCAVAPASAATTEEYVAVAQETMKVMKEFTSVLNSITDKDSADAAAPKVAKLAKKLQGIQAKQEKMGPPSDKVRKEISEKHPEIEQQANEVVFPFLEAMQNVVQGGDEPCFGSEALMGVFANMQAE